MCQESHKGWSFSVFILFPFKGEEAFAAEDNMRSALGKDIKAASEGPTRETHILTDIHSSKQHTVTQHLDASYLQALHLKT